MQVLAPGPHERPCASSFEDGSGFLPADFLFFPVVGGNATWKRARKDCEFGLMGSDKPPSHGSSKRPAYSAFRGSLCQRFPGRRRRAPQSLGT